MDLPVPTANTWQQVTVTLASLGVANNPGFDGFWIVNKTDSKLPTYYVDDIVLVSKPSPEMIRLKVNAGSVVRSLDQRFVGLNTAIWDYDLDSAATGTWMAQAGVKAMRFPAGSLSDGFDWQTSRIATQPTVDWTSSFPAFATQATAVGAQAFLTVSYGSGTPGQAAAWVAYANGDAANTAVIGTDEEGRDWKTAGYWASMRAASPLATDGGYNFLRMSRAQPFAFKYWELGNECFGTWEYDVHGGTLGGSPTDSYTYANYFAKFRQKMLAVDPSIRLGVVSDTDPDSFGNGQHPVINPRDHTTHTGWTPVMLARLAALGATPDFLIYHSYAQAGG